MKVINSNFGKHLGEYISTLPPLKSLTFMTTSPDKKILPTATNQVEISPTQSFNRIKFLTLEKRKQLTGLLSTMGAKVVVWDICTATTAKHV